jgi:SAM-dependent methyltransferase
LQNVILACEDNRVTSSLVVSSNLNQMQNGRFVVLFDPTIAEHCKLNRGLRLATASEIKVEPEWRAD